MKISDIFQCLFFFFSLAPYWGVTECKLNTYGVASHVSLAFLVLDLEYGTKPKGYGIVACSYNVL